MRVTITCLILMLLLTGSLVLAQDEPEITETPEPPITITIWWPDSFARVNDTEINPLLLEQSASFAETVPNVTFEHRLKAVGQTGGIMSTLRSATNAANGALPTLTLLRRQDLLFAASDYLQSMEGFPSLIQGDLNNALQLGQVNDELYGLPYLLELQHMVYRPTTGVDYASWTFDAVLERGESYAFSAAPSNSLSDVLALQYIESGGLPPSSNSLIFDETALSTVFEFYEAATDREILTGVNLNYTTSGNYVPNFVDGNINAGIFTSTRYLALYAEDDSLAMAPIPSQTGTPIGFMNGWIWVMVTHDAEEQAVALDYLNWIFDAERQAAVAENVLMLPSRETALNLGLANDVPIEPYMLLIDNALLPLTESEIGSIGREIQTQFASILTLENSAQEALNAVMRAVGE